jgi:hypothetical protein
VNLKGLFVLLSATFLLLVYSCTKINEATELGSDLIPAVDNVHTFDTTLNLQAAYHIFNDSTKNLISDYMALGQLNDPIFGKSTADMYFNLSSSTYGAYPFASADSALILDSVVLSLGYSGSYGDTTSLLNVQVSEILPSLSFNDTNLYRFDNPALASNSSLGSKTFSIQQLNDSVPVIRKKADSINQVKVANVLRIPLNKSIGQRLLAFDTTSSPLTGGYSRDSIFRSLFRGLAIKTSSASGNGAFGYFNLSDATNTQLIVYCRVKNNGVRDTIAVPFVHSTYSQINSIQRAAASGQYLAGIKSPGLDAFPNKVIHRAEVIAYKVTDPTSVENIFTPPTQLLLDRRVPNSTSDSAYIFENDLQAGTDGSLNFAAFGGTLKSDNSYRFNITRYVQSIVTKKDRNDSLRIYAPLRSILYAKSLGQYISVPNLTYIGSGRVVLAGPSFNDPAMRLRLRIIYSNL